MIMEKFEDNVNEFFDSSAKMTVFHTYTTYIHNLY